jgi:hypothetical protein
MIGEGKGVRQIEVVSKEDLRRYKLKMIRIDT